MIANLVRKRRLPVPSSGGGSLATELGGRHPWRVPTGTLRPIPYLHTLMSTSMRVSNTKAKRELGWSPAVSTYREGIPLVATPSR
jgi:nucleoside-diphosphate-sugar epimerase